MSDIPYPSLSQHTSGVSARLARLRSQVAAWFWVDGLSRVLWLAIGLAAADLVLDWLFRMDRAQRAVMLVLMVAAIGWLVQRRLIRPLAATASDDALALEVEAHNKELGQGLISALQLARLENAEKRGMSAALVEQTVLRGTKAAEGVNFASVLDGREFRLNVLLLTLAVLALGGIAVGVRATEPLAIWFNRNILLGDRYWPQKTYLKIERVDKNGAVVFPRGEDWTQLVTVTEDSVVIPESVVLEFRRTKSRGPLAMKKKGERQFEATFANVIEPFEFRARGGDAVTEWVRVELVEQPGVAELRIVVTPPKYTGGSPEELPPGRGPYYVLAGSSLELSGAANKPLVRGDLRYDGELFIQPEPKTAAKAQHRGTAALLRDAGTRLAGQVPADKLVIGTYVFDLEDTLGLTSRRPTTFAIRKRADREPRVRMRLIGVGGMVTVKAVVPFTCRVSDDFGITSGRVVYRWKGEDPMQEATTGGVEFEQLKGKFGGTELSLDDGIEIEPLKVPTGTGLSFRFESADNDDVSGPNVGRSSEFLLRIVTEDELRTDILRREKEQRQEFERLTKNQDELLTDCRALEAAVKTRPDLAAEQKDQLMQYHKRQKLVGQNTTAIAERLASIVIEIQNNRLEEKGGRFQTRLTTEIIEPMRVVSGELIPQALTGIDKTRRQAAVPAERDAALAETIVLQTEAAAKMKEILEHMAKSEAFQEAVNLLYEIQKVQTDVHDQTNKERQERIKRILEGGGVEKPKP